MPVPEKSRVYNAMFIVLAPIITSDVTNENTTQRIFRFEARKCAYKIIFTLERKKKG